MLRYLIFLRHIKLSALHCGVPCRCCSIDSVLSIAARQGPMCQDARGIYIFLLWLMILAIVCFSEEWGSHDSVGLSFCRLIYIWLSLFCQSFVSINFAWITCMSWFSDYWFHGFRMDDFEILFLRLLNLIPTATRRTASWRFLLGKSIVLICKRP